jgi:hypothetical protein
MLIFSHWKKYNRQFILRSGSKSGRVDGTGPGTGRLSPVDNLSFFDGKNIVEQVGSLPDCPSDGSGVENDGPAIVKMAATSSLKTILAAMQASNSGFPTIKSMASLVSTLVFLRIL